MIECALLILSIMEHSTPSMSSDLAPLTPTAAIVEGLVGGSGSLAGIVVSTLLILCNGMLLSRIVSRYSVSTVRSFLPMLLYTVALCGPMSPYGSVVPQVVALLMIMGSARLVAGFKRTLIFAPLFEGYFLIGTTPLLCPALLPVAVGHLAVMAIYDRTLREWIIGVGGLLLPTLLCSWGWWLLDGAEPLFVVESMIEGLSFEATTLGTLFAGDALTSGLLMAYMTALSLFGTALVVVAGNQMRTRPKKISYHFALITLLALVVLCLTTPSATLYALFACGFAVIAHTCFARWRSVWATACYVVLLIMAFGAIGLRIY